MLIQAAVDLEALGTIVDACSTTYEGLEIDVAAPVQPTRLKLQFANPYAYREALPGGAVFLRLNPAGETSRRNIVHSPAKRDPVTEHFVEVISTHSPGQAIEDGVLVDAGDMAR